MTVQMIVLLTSKDVFVAGTTWAIDCWQRDRGLNQATVQQVCYNHSLFPLSLGKTTVMNRLAHRLPPCNWYSAVKRVTTVWRMDMYAENWTMLQMTSVANGNKHGMGRANDAQHVLHNIINNCMPAGGLAYSTLGQRNWKYCTQCSLLYIWSSRYSPRVFVQPIVHDVHSTVHCT